MKLIVLVNSVIIFLSQMILLKWLNFLIRSLTVTLNSPGLLDLFLSSDASICSAMAFSLLGNSDCVVVLVSIDFPRNSKQNAQFIRYLKTILVLIGMVFRIICFCCCYWILWVDRLWININILNCKKNGPNSN